MASNENLPPRVIKQLARELKSFEESPFEDIRVSVNEDDFSTIYADLDGPTGTPYDGGVFRLKLVLSQGFPQVPPKGWICTRIFHPNISKTGEICVNTLKKDWKPTFGLRNALLAIRCLLIEPFPESALNEEAGKMLMEDYEGYFRHARLMTTIHATKSKSANCHAAPPAPLVQSNVNVDGSLDGALYASGMDPSSACLAPSAKKPKAEIELARPSVERKKSDSRKKTLKRL